MAGWRWRGTAAPNRRRRSGPRAILALLLAAIAPGPALSAPRNVLVLDTGSSSRPLAVALNRAPREALVGTSGAAVSIYEEALDLQRFPGEADAARARAYLAGK
jgi:hypothetical protein